MHREVRRVGILLFDRVTALDVAGPGDAFASAVQQGEESRAAATLESAYEVIMIGLTRRACTAESGLVFQPSVTAGDAPALDTLVIPGGSGLREKKTNDRVSAWIRERAPDVRRIASVCTGIYGLAPTGLLDGRCVTTHWRFAEDVAARFPGLRVRANELFVKDGPFYTSAGVTAGIDLSLSLIAEDLGSSAALGVARELVVYMQRAGGQDQFSEPLQFQSGAPERFADLLAYVAAHLNRDLSVDALARRMAVSPRQFARQCKEALGCSPAALVKKMRLDEAKARLLKRNTTVEAVAASVGFGSPDVFQRAFERRFGINPSAYRGRFKGSEPARRQPARPEPARREPGRTRDR
jgi:transcriptional regulator GlxA family with amidase domain